jgi:hypothetical protein
MRTAGFTAEAELSVSPVGPRAHAADARAWRRLREYRGRGSSRASGVQGGLLRRVHRHELRVAVRSGPPKLRDDVQVDVPEAMYDGPRGLFVHADGQLREQRHLSGRHYCVGACLQG